MAKTIFLLGILVFSILLFGCVQNQTLQPTASPTSVATQTATPTVLATATPTPATNEHGEIARKALEPDVITADVTILALNPSDVCPSGEQACPTDTNPNDSGQIRIDQIIIYYRGDAAIKYNDPQYAPLNKGFIGKSSEVKDVRFLYSARPAKIRYSAPTGGTPVTGPPSSTENPPAATPNEGPGATPPEVQTGPPGAAELVPRENGSFIFYTDKQGLEKVLPGLKVGDKIRVTFDYLTPAGSPLEIWGYGNITCGGEGDIVFVKAGEYCCDGLTRIDNTAIVNKTCQNTAPPDVFYCTTCGNGECGLGENACNCPEDCK